MSLRDFHESDWPKLEAIANAILPDRPEENVKWFANVRGFDDVARKRRRYVVVAADGEVAGYGSVEQDADEPNRYRLRLLMQGQRIARGEADDVIARLMTDLRDLGAQTVWERVDADEPELLAYLEGQGYVPVAESTIGRFHYIRLGRQVSASERAESV